MDAKQKVENFCRGLDEILNSSTSTVNSNDPKPVEQKFNETIDDEDESAEDLLERAEKMLSHIRRPITPTTQIRERLNHSIELVEHAIEIAESQVLASSINTAADTNNSTGSTSSNIPTATIESDDEDVVFVKTTPNRIVPVVDLCTPDDDMRNQTAPKRARSNNSTSIAVTIQLHTPTTTLLPKPKSPMKQQEQQSGQVEKNCAICMDLPFNNRPTSTLCGHVFCQTCIEQAINMYRKCPICNRKLTKKQIHPIFF